MMDRSKNAAANANEAVFGASKALSVPSVQGLFEEMQALMAVMPGTLVDRDVALPTEDEVEAMFDNMPV